MKTKLFSNEIVPNEKFLEDIKVLLDMSDERREKYVKWFNERQVKPQRLEKDEIITPGSLQELVKELGITSNKFYSFNNIVQYFTRQALSLHENIHDFIDDMVSLGIVPEDQKEKIYFFFDEIKQKSIDLAKESRRAAYEKGEIPGLISFGYDVDLRLIPENPFDPQEIKIEEYSPKGAEFIATAIISMRTEKDENENNNIVFQLTFNELEDLIVRMQACQKELRLLKTLSEKFDFSKC